MKVVRRITCSTNSQKGVKRSGVKSGSPTENVNRNLSSSFFEHRLTILELQLHFVDSNILASNPNNSGGYNSKKANVKLAKDGPNVLLPPKEMSNTELFLRQFLNLFWILLIGAGILSLVTYFFDTSVKINLYAAIVLFLIVIIMCIVTFFEEKKARNVVHGFSNLLPAKCTVIRDSHQTVIDSSDIVVGDLVVVKNGSRIPADLRIIHGTALKVEASSITGEAEPVELNAEAVAEHIDVFDAGNVAFNGSFCVDGEGIGICIRTGQATVIGQIAALTTEQEQESSSLQVEINRFVKFVTISALVMGTLIFVIGGFINKWNDILNLFISGFLVVIVANVPQGLPATVTSELTIIARRMASKKVYMKKLDVIEAFGATTVIASDKTGTLTMNKMTVTDVWCGRSYISGIPEVKYKTLHTITAMRDRTVMLGLDAFDKPLPDLITVMTVCNKAEFEATGQTTHFGDGQLTLSRRTRSKTECAEELWRPTGRRRIHTISPTVDDIETGNKLGRRQSTISVGGTKKERRICGSPSEVALLKYADSVTDVAQLRRRYRITFEVPFNSVRKWHLTVVQDATIYENDDENKQNCIAFLKGAPEVIMKKCSQLAVADGCIRIDEEIEMEFRDACDHFGNSGRRVIGFAMKRFAFDSGKPFSPNGSDFPFEDFVFVGLAAIMDPPRPDTADAIERCKRAGIKVFMVTGDHPSTAIAIAKEVGLIGPPKEITVQKTKHSVSLSFAKEEEENKERDWAVVHGSLLPDLNETHWDELLEFSYIVFARTTPEHKLLIVEKCQHRGEVVTVTGDGVNDAPALKKANVGVAMGITGSDVAKQAADVVLMDDNFASIVKGIEEGRLLFDNLRKTIAYTLTHTMPEVVTIIFYFVFGIPMALTTLLILSIDLGTELAPAISLAYENAESDIMEKPPRKLTTRLVSIAMLTYSYTIAGGMVITGSFGAYLYIYYYHGIDIKDIFFSAENYFKHNAIGNFTSNGFTFTEEQQIEIQAQGCAAYYITLVISQVSVYAVIIEVLLMLLFVYIPGINYTMGARPPPYQAWFFAPAVGIALWIYNEIRKIFIRNSPDNSIVRLFKW